jgi:hypothetical protein
VRGCRLSGSEGKGRCAPGLPKGNRRWRGVYRRSIYAVYLQMWLRESSATRCCGATGRPLVVGPCVLGYLCRGLFLERGCLLPPSEDTAGAKLRPVYYAAAATIIFGRYGFLPTAKAASRRKGQPYLGFVQPYPRFLSSLGSRKAI